MLVFLSSLTLIYYTILLGWIWPNNNENFLILTFIDSIGKSFWLTWSLVFIFYFSGVENYYFLLALIFTLIFLTFLFNKQNKIIIIKNDILVLVISFFIIFFIGYELFTNVNYDYSKVFNLNDALHSWNRWASELSSNKYLPTDAGYPLLFPSLWSIMYRYHDNLQLQLIVKLTLFIQPLIIFLITSFLWQIREKVFSVSFLIVSLVLIQSYKGEFLSGHMDAPVAIFILVANTFLVLSIKYINEKKLNFSGSLIEIAGIFSGLAAIIKQPGILSMFMYFFVICYIHKKINIGLKKIFYYISICFLPYVLFIILFKLSDGNLIGNLDYLSNLVKQTIGEKNLYLHSLELVQSNLGQTFGIFILLFSLFNLLKINKNIHMLGTLFLLMGILGFFSFSHCCAYAARNGWWIMSFLSSSFFCSIYIFVSNKEKISFYYHEYIQKNTFYMILLLIIFVGSLIITFKIDDEHLISLEKQNRWELVDANISKFFQNKIDIFDESSILVGDIDKIRFLPSIGKNFQFCWTNDKKCFENKLKLNKKTYLLIKSKDFKNSFIANKSFEKIKIHKFKATSNKEYSYLFMGPFTLD